MYEELLMEVKWNSKCFLTQEKMIWKSFVTIIKSQSRDDKKKRFKAINN